LLVSLPGQQTPTGVVGNPPEAVGRGLRWEGILTDTLVRRIELKMGLLELGLGGAQERCRPGGSNIKRGRAVEGHSACGGSKHHSR